MIRAVLLDRDGTISTRPAAEWVTRPADLQLLPGAGEAVARLTAAGLPVHVVTNQRGVAVGRMTLADVGRINERLVAELADAGGRVDGVWVCPHGRDDGCRCRKPRPGLLVDALAAAGVEPADAIMVGDDRRDVAAGRAAGTHTIRLAEDADPDADATTPDLAAAVDLIVKGLL